MLVGVDRNPRVLLQASSQLPTAFFLQAEAADLPFGYTSHFDLIIARHPDIDRYPADWRASFATLPRLLKSAGRLVVTTYNAAELTQIRDWLTATVWQEVPLDRHRLVAPGLQGRDAHVLCWCGAA